VAAADADGFVREALDAYAPATVNLDVNVLVDVFHSAMREELVDRNPAKLAERPKVPRRNWRILGPAEAGRVAAAFMDSQARAVFLTLILTGLRRHELQALRWRDVDLLEGVLRVRDSNNQALPRPCRRHLPLGGGHAGGSDARCADKSRARRR